MVAMLRTIDSARPRRALQRRRPRIAYILHAYAVVLRANVAYYPLPDRHGRNPSRERCSRAMKALMRFRSIRSLTWRVGRKLYCMARREGGNSPDSNGEYWLLGCAVAADATGPAVLVDIGANVGDWSARATARLDAGRIPGNVYALEPAASTYAFLCERFKGSNRVVSDRIALSDRSGEAAFFVVGERAGTNSLLEIDGATAETVRTITFDQFVHDRGLGHIRLVKCDTEGHDFSVMSGAAQSLRQGRIDVWQFEYNHRWIGNGSSLRDVFTFIADKPYTLGKLYGNGIECFARWNPELDRFFETNFVLVRNGCDLDSLCAPFEFDTSNTLVPSSTPSGADEAAGAVSGRAHRSG